MDSEALVHLALKALSCTQKQLASRLGVSPTQITKWKGGEHMSRDMEDRLRALARVGDRNPVFVLEAGSVESADKWGKLIRHLAEVANESAETGYDTYPLEDDLGLLPGATFQVLKDIGVSLPVEFPKNLDVDYDRVDDGEHNDFWEELDTNPYSALIYKIYKSLNDVWGFYAAYVDELMNDEDLGLDGTDAQNIEPCLIDLAATKVEINSDFAPKFGEFKHRTTKDYVEWLTIVKDKCFRSGTPMRAELLKMVYASHEAIGHAAEAESLGFNASRLHPDIYMNELLVGMRTIHQVLPAILKKLGIDEEFKLDTSEFYVGGAT